MDLDRALLEIGGTPVTLLDLLIAAAVFALLLLIAAVILSWRAQASRQRPAAAAHGGTRIPHRRTLRRAEKPHRAVAGLPDAARLDARREAGPRVGAPRHQLVDQAERTGQSLKQLNERLAVIDAAQKNIEALSSEMLGLKDILSNKQARGAYGQARMEAIIRDGLQAGAYAFQGRSATARGPTASCRFPIPASSW